MRCAWAHCGACFEGGLPAGWRWVFRHVSTGEHGVLCPEHALEAGEREARWLVLYSQGLPRLSFDDPGADGETKRLLKGRMKP